VLTAPDFGFILTAVLPKLKVFWAVTVPEISEDRSAFISLYDEADDNTIL
jgi:hypothetical protein